MTEQANKLPSALENKNNIIKCLQEGRPVIFLDYDGTLTPIVEDPSEAILPEKTRQMIEKLSDHWTVVIMTGRDLNDAKRLVGLENLVYAGSHGLDISWPEKKLHDESEGQFLAQLDKAEEELRNVVKDFDGVRLERKRYALAIHFRQAKESIIPELKKQVDDVAGHFSRLLRTEGKKIFELRPQSEWNKGKAALYLIEKLNIDQTCSIPVYIGDDKTDEDAFQAIGDQGIGILVTDEDQSTDASYVVRNPDEVAAFLEELVRFAKKNSAINVWSLTYEGFDPLSEKLRESLCTLGNGYFATRGAAPESTADDTHYPGTYIAGIYNRLKSHIADRVIENESMVNAPNWLPLHFQIESDGWFDLESVDILNYRQELNMMQGILVRTVRFEDDKGRRTRLIQQRFVHMRHQHVAGLETTVLAENWSGTIRIRSALDGRMENTLVERYRQLNNRHLELCTTGVTDDGIIWLDTRTNQSHIGIAEAARTSVFYKNKAIEKQPRLVNEEGYIGQDFEIDMRVKEPVRIEKIVAIYSSRDHGISKHLLEAQDALRHIGDFDDLLECHIIAWKHLWERWRIKVNVENRRAEKIMNMHIFHLLQTVSPNTVGLDVGVPPRGLHGEAYRGLIMWDELFIFPLFNLRMPDITRSLLIYRFNRMARASWSAKQSGYSGTLFPWQSGSNGEEQAQKLHLNPESGRWIPDNSQLEQHINIAIAYNIWQYYQVTKDMNFMCYYGAELIIGIARFWASKATYNPSMGRYEICKVMGPDEFHEKYPDASEPGIDNNAYTNVMVAWIFWRALEMLDMLPEMRRKFIMEDKALDEAELKKWEQISRTLYIPFHDDGIISQFDGYQHLKEFNWQEYRKKYGNIQRLDRILEAEGNSPNHYKLSKQADVLMLFFLLSADELQALFDRLNYPFRCETIPDNIAYYLKRTSHGSTLSRVVHAWVLSRSKREMSWRLFQEALGSDIEDIQGGTTKEGIHLGAMAGTVDLVLRCYSGIESRDDVLWFNPGLPSELKCLQFNVIYRKNSIDVKITAERIELHSHPDNENSVEIGLDSKMLTLSPGDTKIADL